MGRFPAVLAVLAGTGWAHDAAAQSQTLRFKFPVGQTWKFKLTSRSATEDAGGDKPPVVVNTSQTIEYRWRILGVAASGAGEIAQAFERIRFDAEGGPGGVAHLDTADPPGKDDKTGFRKLVGPEFRFELSAEGAIANIRMPEGWDGAAKDAAGKPAVPPALADLLNSGVVPLPKAAVRPGDQWVQPPLVVVDSVARFATRVEDRFVGMAEHAGRPVAKLLRKPQFELTVMPNKLGLAGKMNSQSASATVLFDAAAGRIAQAELAQKFQWEITARGKGGTRSVDTATTLEFVK